MDFLYNYALLTRFLKTQKTDVVGTLDKRRMDCPSEIKSLNDKTHAEGNVKSTLW